MSTRLTGPLWCLFVGVRLLTGLRCRRRHALPETAVSQFVFGVPVVPGALGVRVARRCVGEMSDELRLWEGHVGTPYLRKHAQWRHPSLSCMLMLGIRTKLARVLVVSDPGLCCGVASRQIERPETRRRYPLLMPSLLLSAPFFT